jgi:hypothetical protein
MVTSDDRVSAAAGRPLARTVTVRRLPGGQLAALADGGVTVLVLWGVMTAAEAAGVPMPGWWPPALFFGVGPAAAVLAWWVTAIRFETDCLVVIRPWRRRRIAWTALDGAGWYFDRGSENSDVVSRWAAVYVQRHPGEVVPPAPETFGEFRRWHRQYYRTLRLPILFPEETPAPPTAERPGKVRARRAREVVREQLAARERPLPGD